MFNTLYPAYIKTAVAIEDLKQNASKAIAKIERGDADSSGSTLRTLGIVVLVVLVVSAIGVAVATAGTNIAGKINETSFNFKAK